MNYAEFISTVKDADPSTYWERVKHKAHEDFQFTDMEVGKIYVVLTSDGRIWFLTPTFIERIDHYRLLWVNFNPYGSNKLGKMSFAKDNGEVCEGWSDYVWGHRRWIEFDDLPSFDYINWIDNPFEVKS